MSNLNQFQNQQYLNLETFRKSGVGVKTPVWFAQEGDTLWVWTQFDAGKAKRVRNNGRVNIAPCKADGALLGDWVPATAQADSSPEAVNHVRQLFQKKYGLMFALFGLMGALRRAKYTAIKITVSG
ncbi:MAG: PPOX class F420-dependent oxidoreductase [Anaerolineales bacterium]